MNKSDLTVQQLRTFGLSTHEANIYLELLGKPATHAQLSLATGINRTTVYRMVGALEKRGLITRRLDDTGKFLTAADPATLEVEVVTQEEKAKQQRIALAQLLPTLENVKKGSEADFTILTYEGTDGFKRMLWHELKTTGECLCIGMGTLEDLVSDRRWTEKHRDMTVAAGYRIREITNPGGIPRGFTRNQAFAEQFHQTREVPSNILPIHHLMTVHNDTVAIYNLFEGRRMGLEITSHAYAQTMRGVFEQFWQLGTVPTDISPVY